MAETEWSEDAPEPPKKKGGIPKWVWFGCGGGCLLIVILIVVIGIAGVQVANKISDPEYAKEQIAQLVPYEEWPEGYTANGFGMFGNEQYYVQVPNAAAMMIIIRVPNTGTLDNMFDPESRENKGVFGIGQISNAEEGTIEIQGREVRCLRFEAWIPESASEDGQEVEGPSIRVDVTGEGGVAVLIQVTMPNAPEGVPDELVQEMLAPFDVWRGK